MGSAQLRLRLEGRHRFDMFGLVISNGSKYIVQIVNLGPPYLTRTCLKLVEHIEVIAAVVIYRSKQAIQMRKSFALKTKIDIRHGNNLSHLRPPVELVGP